MTFMPKNLRDHLAWLHSPAVRRFSAQLRPQGAALPASDGSVKEYVQTHPAGDLQRLGLPPRRKGQPRAVDIIDRIPLSAATHEVTDATAIRDALQTICDRGEAVTIYTSDAAAGPQLARILAVHAGEPHFTLQLNDGAVLPPGKCTFVSRLESARCQFELQADWAPHPGTADLVPAPFPELCHVLNRRSSARLEAPLVGNYAASFVLFGNPFELQLYDLAAGGIGMRCAPRDAPGLHIGRKLQRVRLELGDTVVICDLEVRLSRRFRSFLLGEQVQIGCRFVDLSPQMQTAVEKAIAKLALGRR
jgi:flagellar brake protein